MVRGKRKLKAFATRDEAHHFKAKREEKQALENPTELIEPDALGNTASRHALDKGETQRREARQTERNEHSGTRLRKKLTRLSFD